MADVQTSTMTYRLFEEADLAGVLRLWEANSGWGSITAEQFRKWYVDGPFEPALITVAADQDGEIAGQEVFTPCRLVVDGREVRALRLSAPILRADLRTAAPTAADHPVIQLYFAALARMRERGYSCVFALAERVWVSFFRVMPRRAPGLPIFQTAEPVCRSLPLAAAAADAGERWKAWSAEAASWRAGELDELWAEARAAIPFRCAVARTAEWVRFKNGGHLTLDVRDDTGRLVGYCAVRRQSGLVADLLARRQAEIPAVLATVAAWLRAHPAEVVVEDVKVLETPLLAPALDELGFEAVDFRFGFVATSIDPGLPLDDLDPAGWWLTAGD